MKKLVVVAVIMAFFAVFCPAVVMAYVITFDDAAGLLPYEAGEYVVYSPLDAPEDRIVYDPATGEGYLEAGFWVGIERIDGGAFVLGGFDGRSPSGIMEVWTEEHQASFAVGTDSFQPAVAPSEDWDPNESFFSLSFWAGDIDNLELASKTLIPKPTPSVPIPGAVWLLGAGLSGIAAYRRKRS